MNSRLDCTLEEMINEFEDLTIELIQSKTDDGKKKKEFQQTVGQCQVD